MTQTEQMDAISKVTSLLFEDGITLDDGMTYLVEQGVLNKDNAFLVVYAIIMGHRTATEFHAGLGRAAAADNDTTVQEVRALRKIKGQVPVV